jgi:ABC-2 type transport system ATP-binding protein
MIEARDLVKRYGSTMAVNDLSFSIRPGVVTGFLGPNGAGKPNIGQRHFFWVQLF